MIDVIIGQVVVCLGMKSEIMDVFNCIVYI